MVAGAAASETGMGWHPRRPRARAPPWWVSFDDASGGRIGHARPLNRHPKAAEQRSVGQGGGGGGATREHDALSGTRTAVTDRGNGGGGLQIVRRRRAAPSTVRFTPDHHNNRSHWPSADVHAPAREASSHKGSRGNSVSRGSERLNQVYQFQASVITVW